MIGWTLALIKNLPRIQNPVRIERAAEFAHDTHLGVAGEFGKKTFFGEADTVLAGDRAAKSNGFVENFPKRFFDAVHFVFVSFVGKNSRMQVAVGHVAEGADLEPVFLGGELDEAHHGRQFTLRHGHLQESSWARRGPRPRTLCQGGAQRKLAMAPKRDNKGPSKTK